MLTLNDEKQRFEEKWPLNEVTWRATENTDNSMIFATGTTRIHRLGKACFQSRGLLQMPFAVS